MGIDVWEAIEAVKSKPFGYMPFYPGPGLGGHFIPIDPFYLTWQAREFDVATRFAELAGEVNTAMPQRVVAHALEALSERTGRAARGARMLILGVAYKRNVDDRRESPAFKIMEFLEKRGMQLEYHDPMVAETPMTREHAVFAGRRSVPLTRDVVSGFDAAIICTDHVAVDYACLVAWSRLVIDTRNVYARTGALAGHVVRPSAGARR